MSHFQVRNSPSVLKNFLLSRNHWYYFHLPIGPFHCAKFFLWIQSYVDAQFLGPKWPIFPNENFFRKPVNEPCFFHSCLSTYQKSKSDINLLEKYWRLKNTEISLAENLRTRFFPSMQFPQNVNEP